MTIIDLGSWGPAVRHEDPETGVVFAKYQNANGDDWYETVAHDPARPTGLALGLADDGRVLFRVDDVAQMEPSNKRVIVIPDPSSIDLATLFQKRFDFDLGEFVRIVSSEEINRERTRRERVGTTIEIAGYGPVPIQGRPEDKTNLQALAFAASLRQQAGVERITQFRDANNVDHELNNAQMIELYAKGAAWMEEIYKASWVIKAMNPPPQNYDDDSYWL